MFTLDKFENSERIQVLALRVTKDTVGKFIKFENHVETFLGVLELRSEHETCQFRLKLTSEEIFKAVSLDNAFLNVKFWHGSI